MMQSSGPQESAAPGSLLLSVALVGFAACVVEEPERRRFDDDGGAGGAAVSTTSLSSSVGGGFGGQTASSTSVASTSAAVTSSSSSTGTGCNDLYPEPNDTQANAIDLGAIDSCDSSEMTEQGTLAGNDIDWFTFEADAAPFCWARPYGRIVSDSQTRMCMYFLCKSAPSPDVDCKGAQPATAPQGQPGCCGSSELEPKIACDSAFVWIRVDKPPVPACVDYSVTFHY